MESVLDISTLSDIEYDSIIEQHCYIIVCHHLEHVTGYFIDRWLCLS